MPKRAAKRNTSSTRGGYRPGSGRKPRAKGTGAHLHVRVSPDELAEIARRADAAGLSVSEFVRKTLLQ